MTAQSPLRRKLLRWEKLPGPLASYPAWPGMLGLLLAVSGLRHPLPPAPSTSTGFPALLNTVLTLALWTLIVLLGAALGRRILQWFRLPWASPNESLWFELPTGLIGLGYPVYALGMTGHFHRSELAVLFIVLVAAFGREIHEAAHHIWQGLLTAWMGWLRLPPLRKLLWGWMILLGAGSFLLALTPHILRRPLVSPASPTPVSKRRSHLPRMEQLARELCFCGKYVVRSAYGLGQ